MDYDSLPSAVTEHRHIPARRVLPRRSTTSRTIRSLAKRLAESKDPNICQTLKLPCIPGAWSVENEYGGVADEDHAAHGHKSRFRRVHLEKDVRNMIAALPSSHARPEDVRPPPKEFKRNDEDEGRELALSDVPLPGDRSRVGGVTGQGCEASLYLASITARSKVRILPAAAMTEDAQVAQLYHDGLLHDNEEGPEEVVSLNSIRHEDPIYTIRPARRTRKTKKAGGLEKRLQLDSSLEDLLADSMIAAIILGAEAAAGAAAGQPSGDEAIQPSTQDTAQSSPVLEVIYEQACQNPSDEETHLLPDLIPDDFEHVSDSDLDEDVPNQTEVLEGATNPPTDTWILVHQRT